MDPMNFHDKLVMCCDAKGWNQASLFRAVGGVSRTTVSNWFNHESKPDMETALRIARALDVPLDYLADDTIDEPPAPAAQADWGRTVLELIRALRLDEAEAMRRIATGGAMPPRQEDGETPISPKPLPPAGPRILGGLPADKPGTPRKKQQG